MNDSTLRRLIVSAILTSAVWSSGEAIAQVDHPVISELYQLPPAAGGPVGRDPLDPHQEFIEIYIPPLADLAAALLVRKDSFKLTIYDVEGDSSSPELSLVNYRIDLPAFDLDPSNGLTGLPRPTTGVVVLGWVDYANPPTDLAGTPATRLALINGGVTSTTGFTFIAINGSHFTGTTNFPVPDAISFLNDTTDPVTGKIEQGSSALLLVDRDAAGYTELCGNTDPAPCSSFPNLPAGTILGVSSLLDGFAPNDDNSFDPTKHPYAAPTGDNIDLEFVLPLGGAFSVLVPQLKEEGDGYQRFFTDLLKTTEDASPDDPVLDSLTAYGSTANIGPFAPSPGVAPATTSAASLSVADTVLQNFQVLTNTSARPGILAANVGGDFAVDTITTPGASSTPAQMTIQPGSSSFGPIGQIEIDPAVEVTTFATTTAGHMETVSVQIDAMAAGMGDPPVLNPTATIAATFTAINPIQGIDALGLPFQATSFLAVHGLPDQPGVLNEFVSTSLAQRLATSLGVYDFDSRGSVATLLDPLVDLSDPLIIDPLIATMPTDPLEFINAVGTGGTLVSKVQGSAVVASGSTLYDESFNIAGTLVKAREFAIPGIITSGSGFVPSERIHYADLRGLPGAGSSGLTDVLTGRDFELVLIETSLEVLGTVESGETEDFGLVLQVETVEAGAMVAVNEFVMLSFMGGLEGADVDSLNVPPFGNLTNIIYVDLDPLRTFLGVKTVSRVFVIDGSGGSEADVIDVIALPEPGVLPALACGIALLLLLSRRASSRRRVCART